MFENLDSIECKFNKLEKDLIDPEVLSDSEKYQELAKEHASLKDIVEKYRLYKDKSSELEDAKSMLDEDLDQEMKEMVHIEIESLNNDLKTLEEEIKVLLIPKDENDDKNVIVEIRAGAGGDEAALFAGDLYRMYSFYAEKKGWTHELMSQSEIGIGGYKEVIFMIKGNGAYSRLKYESGVHRVQRVPETESSGRIHTSTVTVAVLPEIDDIEVNINPQDLQIDTYRASGAGGQHVNVTDSAVRITHIPTGVVVAVQDERSQHKNREKAMKILNSRIYEKELEEQRKAQSDDRSSQVGTGDRSERIRTYNFPQGRITDHRISRTQHRMEEFLDGDIDEMVDALTAEDNAKKIANIES